MLGWMKNVLLNYPSGVHVVSLGRKPKNRDANVFAPDGVFVLLNFAERLGHLLRPKAAKLPAKLQPLAQPESVL